MFIVKTMHDVDADTFGEPDRFYGLFAFKESANHVGGVLTAAGGPEFDRAFDVHEVIQPGPGTLSEWLQLVRVEIERQFSAYYNVDEDTFYETMHCEDGDEEDRANEAYKGAKLAMQLLQVQ